MGIVMNMSSYEIELDPMKTEHGEEVMCAGWNTAVALVCQQPVLEPTNRRTTMPADLALADAELFLQKMYACQR